jgi:glycosyltransferase involved in cell wall biosynthesis
MKILSLTNSLYGPYGYSTQMRNIAKRLRGLGYSFANIGMQTIGNAIKDENGTINFPIRYNNFSSDSIRDYLEAYDPDVIITMFDIWVSEGETVKDAIIEKGIPWICHITISHIPVLSGIVDRAEKADVIVAPSKFNFDAISKTGLGSKAVYIPHGVDLEKFYPDRKAKEKIGLEEKFVFLNVSRNRWPQKNLYSLLYAYKMFINSFPTAKENTKLIIAADTMEELPLNIILYRNNLKLKENVDFLKCRINDDGKISFCLEKEEKSFYLNANYRLEEDEMRRLYNSADCYITVSVGESFNLPCLESMACGIPQISPNHSTGPELVGESKSGFLCGLSKGIVTPQQYIIDSFSFLEMANCMRQIYSDHEQWSVFSKNALNHAKKYSWDKIFPLWRNQIEKMESMINSVDYQRGYIGI